MDQRRPLGKFETRGAAVGSGEVPGEKVCVRGECANEKGVGSVCVGSIRAGSMCERGRGVARILYRVSCNGAMREVRERA